MAKIDKVVLGETYYIATVTAILSVLMQAVFLVCAKWDYTVLLGNILGYVAGVGNFLLMGLSVQKAVTKDEKEAGDIMKLSLTYRNLLLVVIIGAGAVISWFNIWAVVLPVLFPRVAIALHPILNRR